MNNFHLTSLHIDNKAYKENTGWSRFYCDDFTFKPGINLLFGGNGQGKSSLIEFLSAYAGNSFEGEKIKKYCTIGHNGDSFRIYSFSNSKNNQRYNSDIGSMFELARHWDSKQQSEGQTVMQTVSDFLYFLNGLDTEEKAVVLIDEVDSGLDAIACQHIVRRIKKILKEKPNLQIFLAFNQYEMSKLDDEWLNVCTGQIEKCPKTYDEYVKRLRELKKEYKRKVDRYVKE
jgi:ABC-type multidrug transport system ATPase subunit